ncbi:hypothetical protein LTR94_036534, partial [Friedmanniomyces endolithicus]
RAAFAGFLQVDRIGGAGRGVEDALGPRHLGRPQEEGAVDRQVESLPVVGPYAFPAWDALGKLPFIIANGSI